MFFLLKINLPPCHSLLFLLLVRAFLPSCTPHFAAPQYFPPLSFFLVAPLPAYSPIDCILLHSWGG